MYFERPAAEAQVELDHKNHQGKQKNGKRLQVINKVNECPVEDAAMSARNDPQLVREEAKLQQVGLDAILDSAQGVLVRNITENQDRNQACQERDDGQPVGGMGSAKGPKEKIECAIDQPQRSTSAPKACRRVSTASVSYPRRPPGPLLRAFHSM